MIQFRASRPRSATPSCSPGANAVTVQGALGVQNRPRDQPRAQAVRGPARAARALARSGSSPGRGVPVAPKSSARWPACRRGKRPSPRARRSGEASRLLARHRENRGRRPSPQARGGEFRRASRLTFKNRGIPESLRRARGGSSTSGGRSAAACGSRRSSWECSRAVFSGDFEVAAESNAATSSSRTWPCSSSVVWT